jgi:bifunctional UDP-N-acetylglucosamine pyrophosphorylase/glucosamine-1-phosphate N-acetyltransferase
MGNTHKHNFAAIILAAGKGTRMRSALPKVLHRVAGQPMIAHVLAALSPLAPEKTIVVTAPGMKAVEEEALRKAKNCRFVIQEEQKGTGHAVACAQKELVDYHDTVLVLYGDIPLITPHTLHHLIHATESADIVVLGMHLANPAGYGRLVLDGNGQLEEIVEDRDANAEQRKITLCNSGIMAVRGKLLFPLLSRLTTTNAAGEYYLTDIVSLADADGLHCHVAAADATEVMGINSRDQLAQAEYFMQQRLRSAALEQGATLIDPMTVYFHVDTQLGQDVTIYPQVVFGPGVTVEEGAEIRSFSHIEGAHIHKNAVIGPFARIRPGSIVGEGAHVGNFVELKKTDLGKGAKANHLSYVGDATVGEGANIGAGTITCNYDGKAKHQTVIGAGAFIGSNSSLVAPVTIGDGAIIGAGSVVTQDVDADALAIARPQQINKPGKASEFRQRKKSS